MLKKLIVAMKDSAAQKGDDCDGTIPHEEFASLLAADTAVAPPPPPLPHASGLAPFSPPNGPSAAHAVGAPPFSLSPHLTPAASSAPSPFAGTSCAPTPPFQPHGQPPPPGMHGQPAIADPASPLPFATPMATHAIAQRGFPNAPGMPLLHAAPLPSMLTTRRRSRS